MSTPRISFEFFPPKSDEMEERLWQSITALAPLKPRFVSVTYGAGGSTRERTHSTVKRILAETELTPAAHLTCVGADCAEIQQVARDYWEAGVRHIVALRGDVPGGDGGYIPHPQGYAYADNLVKGLKEVADFEISVAAYPEKHPEAQSLQADIDHLKRKIDAGATRAITQYFFDVDLFLRYRDAVAAAGITAELTPGIMPVGNFAQAVKFSAMCGASIPQWLRDLFEGAEHNAELQHLLAAYVAAEQCRLLRLAGVESLHFYTLNRAELTQAICHLLGMKPQAA